MQIGNVLANNTSATSSGTSSSHVLDRTTSMPSASHTRVFHPVRGSENNSTDDCSPLDAEGSHAGPSIRHSILPLTRQQAAEEQVADSADDDSAFGDASDEKEFPTRRHRRFSTVREREHSRGSDSEEYPREQHSATPMKELQTCQQQQQPQSEGNGDSNAGGPSTFPQIATVTSVSESFTSPASGEKETPQFPSEPAAPLKSSVHLSVPVPALRPRVGSTGSVSPTSPATPSGGIGVLSKFVAIVRAKKKIVHQKNVRLDKLISSLPWDNTDHVDIPTATRVLLASGVTLAPHALERLENPGGSTAISREELHVILIKQADEFDKMDHLDLDEADDEEKKTVAMSRLVISTRISAMATKNKLSGSIYHQAFDVLHMTTIFFFFLSASLYNWIYFEKEPVGVYGTFWFCWVVWICDIIWNLLLPVANESGKVVSTFTEIAWEKRHVLALDVFCAIPIDMILYWFCEDKQDVFLPFDRDHKVFATFLILRLMKLVKPLRILSLFQFVNLDIITPSFVTFFFLVKPTLRIVAFAITMIQILVVLMANLQKEDFSQPPDYPYLDNAVFVISMLSGAGPNVSFSGLAGTLYELVLVACGLIAQAAVISNLSVTVFRNDVDTMNVEQMRETLGILEHFKVPQDVGTEILSYQLHALSDDVTVRLATLDTLPSKMQKEVLLYVKVAAVNTVKLFSKATHGCKMKIAESLNQTVVGPTTDIVCIGDIGEEMFLIAHGYATVIIFNGMTVAMLSRGDYFGEVALLLPNNVRQATVRALTYCDLWVLDKKSFIVVLDEFPSLLHAMEDDLKAKGIDVSTLDLGKKKAEIAAVPKKEEVTPEPAVATKSPELALFDRDDVSQSQQLFEDDDAVRKGSLASAGLGRSVFHDDDERVGTIGSCVEHQLKPTAFTTAKGSEPSMLEQTIDHMNFFNSRNRGRRSKGGPSSPGEALRLNRGFPSEHWAPLTGQVSAQEHPVTPPLRRASLDEKSFESAASHLFEQRMSQALGAGAWFQVPPRRHSERPHESEELQRRVGDLEKEFRHLVREVHDLAQMMM